MNPIIFVPGFKGSLLSYPNKGTDWLTGTVALGLRTPRMSLPLTFEGGRQSNDGRAATGALETVTIIPTLIEEAVYAPWLATLKSLGRPWYVFAYDWRRDNTESAARLAEFVKDVRGRHASQTIDIVAHSMGGLVTLAALHDGLDGIGQVIFAGSPFRGGVGFLDDMHAGTRTGLNGAVLSPAVLATFPSVYTFFPLHGARLLDADGNAMEVDLYRAETWREQRLGIYQNANWVPAGFETFLQETLARARAFRERLETVRSSYPHIKALVGISHPTLVAIRQKSESGMTWDVRGGERDAGDGRVCAVHALPPEGIPFERYTSTFEHGAILNDPQVASLITRS